MLSNDVELNGVEYNVVPGQYKKLLRKRQSPSKPAARRITRTELGPFSGGLGQSVVEGNAATAGWDGLTVGPAFDGLGVEPFPNVTAFADTTTDVPSTTLRAYGVVAGTNAFIGLGRRIYKSVLLTNGVWATLTAVADLGAGFTISGLAYFQDDILIMLSTGQDIRRLNTVTNAVTIWRTGEKAQKGAAYAGQFIYAPNLANNQEELRLSGTKWNGNAVTHLRYLDAPIITMAHFNGKVAIATRKSLYFMAGHPYPGEADDAAITGDSSRAPEWRGDPEPVMTHGVFAEGDDFTFLESYRGKLYTWMGGRVAEFDDSAEQGRWTRMGPEGTACFGACVAGDWLVAIESRYGGNYELWGCNGEGWWLFGQRAAGSTEYLWPCPLAGAGNRDLLVFRDGGVTYDLARLKWRSTVLNTYATVGTWTSPLIEGGDPSADKAWRAIGATFSAPSVRGNSASVDLVSFPLEYSLDGGATWATVQSVDASSGATRVFTRGQEFAVPPQSRLLQVRQRWSSVSDWAPVLTGIWVESEDAQEYALAEAAQTAYENELAAEATLRRRWELTIDAGERNVKRDGQRDTKTGRQAITAPWDAWETGAAVLFKDIDNDTDAVTYTVSIVGMEEKAGKPSDSGRWGEGTIALTLEEGTSGAVALPVSFLLEDLGDVDLAALGPLLDGQSLVYDTALARWTNEFTAGGGGPHSHDAADIVSGLLDESRLGAGVPDGTKFLRDDQVWAVPSLGGGGGDVLGPAGAVDGQLVLFDSATGKDIKASTHNGIIVATAGVASALGSSGSGDVVRKDGPILGAGSAVAGSKPKLTSGALLTVPEAGAIEFLNNVPYFTPSVGGRAVDWVTHLSRMATDSAHWLNVDTPTNIFPAAQDTFTAPGSTTYFFELLCRLSNAGAASVILGFGLAGTATYNLVTLATEVTMAATDAIGTALWHFYTTTHLMTSITLASGATAKHMSVKIEGTVDIANAGTVIPQLDWSAVPGAVTTVKRGAIWRMTPIGPNGLTVVGAIT